MTLKLVRRSGLDGGETVAIWEEGEGFTRASPDLRFTDDGVYEHYTEEMMYAEFDGPDLFAVPAGDTPARPTQKSLTDFRKSSEGSDDRVYVDSVDDAPADAVVHCEPGDDGDLYYEP